MEEPLHIDIKEAIESKLPRISKLLPRFVFGRLAKLIRQDELNRILLENKDFRDTDFATGTLRSMGIHIVVEGLENVPTEGRFIFASNHPLGGLDGIALISIIGQRYGGNVRCIVNDLLMAVKPLGGVFLPINKYGSQSKQSIRQIDEAYAGDAQMIMFPAGYCSRMNRNGDIRDLEWKKSFITKSVSTRRNIVPVYFDGVNSDFFYKFAKYRKSIGIKASLETIFLPSEMVKSEGKTFGVKFGKPIPYTLFDSSRSQAEWADRVKGIVYAMGNAEK